MYSFLSVGKVAETAVGNECIFDNMALYFECLQTVFWAILPTGFYKDACNRMVF